jgi:hypothetical protein
MKQPQAMALDTSYRSVNLDNHSLNDPNFTPTPPAHLSLLPQKPSIIEPTKTTLQQLLMELSPGNETNIKKYLLNPPSESWEPITGAYSIQIDWTYELGEVIE